MLLDFYNKVVTLSVMTKYLTVHNTDTLKGLKTAERLKARGWTVIRSGLFHVIMAKRSK